MNNFFYPVLNNSPPLQPTNLSSTVPTNNETPPRKRAQKRKASQTNSTIKRQHCKVKLYNIILDALNNPTTNNNSSSVKWVNVGKNFQVNWENFKDLYHSRGGSSANVTNIKNRFTRKSNGFKKDETQVPEQGYDTVYYHESWKSEPSKSLSEKPISEKPNQPSSIPISLIPSTSEDQNQPQHQHTMILSAPPFPENQFTSQANHFRQSFHPHHLVSPNQLQCDLAYLKEMFKDDIVVHLLTHPYNMIKDGSLLIRDLLMRMDNEPKLTFMMTQSDCNNFTILMASESPSPKNERITLEEFKNFLLRFGPLTKSLVKIRDFVNAGAISWFHGNITREKSEEILINSLDKEKCTHFLLRSAKIKEGVFISDTYIFAVSVIMKCEPITNNPIPNGFIINHIRIFTDSQGKLKALGLNRPIPFNDFDSCLKILKLETYKPVPCSDFMYMSKYHEYEKIDKGYFDK